MEHARVGSDGKLHLNNVEEWRYWALDDGDHVERPLTGMEDA